MHCEELNVGGLVLSNVDGKLHINGKPVISVKDHIEGLPIKITPSGDVYVKNVSCDSISCKKIELRGK
jgi:hypothetical protein